MKTVWMDLVFLPGTPVPTRPQQPGAAFDQSKWAYVSTTAGFGINPTGASTDTSPGGAFHVYQTWQIFPQPVYEYIYIGQLLASVGRAQPDQIFTQTTCPEPGALSLACGSVLLLSRRNRRECRRAERFV